MRYQGKITGWKDDKGFGFVIPNGGGQKAFVYFANNERANISETEEKALKLLAKELLGYSDPGLVNEVKAGELIEVRSNEKDDS